VTSQLALDLPVASTVDVGEIVECEPGQELLADLASISSMIPWFGKRHDTARADVMRPIVYLYGRPSVLGESEKLLCYAASHRLFRHRKPGQAAWARLADLAFAAGLVSRGDGGVRGDFWVRVTGEKEGPDARSLVKRVTNAVADQQWMVEMPFGLGNGVASSKTEEIGRRILRTLRMTCTGWVIVGGTTPPNASERLRERDAGRPAADSAARGFLLPNLAPLVLAMRWEPAIEAAVILARHGVLPGDTKLISVESRMHRLEAMYAQHGVDLGVPLGLERMVDVVDEGRTWDVLVDAALDRGQPWAERLLGIGKLPATSSVVRALRWVSEQPR
jgi:hypothetical protein